MVAGARVKEPEAALRPDTRVLGLTGHPSSSKSEFLNPYLNHTFAHQIRPTTQEMTIDKELLDLIHTVDDMPLAESDRENVWIGSSFTSTPCAAGPNGLFAWVGCFVTRSISSLGMRGRSTTE